MRLWLVTLHILLVGCSVLLTKAYEDIGEFDENDFAEFEQFDSDDVDVKKSSVKIGVKHPVEDENEFERVEVIEEDAIVEDEDSEFEHFQDPEEFEGFSDNAPFSGEPKITINKVPIKIRSKWDAYWIEGLACIALVIYCIAYAIGRTKNTYIANNFMATHGSLFEENFALVGIKDGESGWRREADHLFLLWCSGRISCEGMLLTLRLIKRQDLISVVWGKIQNTVDTLQIKVDLSKEGDPFVFLLAQKKIGAKIVKEMQDLSTFAVERREASPLQGWSVWAETAEISAAIMDAKLNAVWQQYSHLLQYLHISDQYSGPKQIDDAPVTKPPETQRCVIMSVTLPNSNHYEELRPILLLVFHIVDKLKRLRLSKESLAKTEKNRQRAESAFLRSTHLARQEAAAVKREEKRKAEKEKIMAEDDPEKQRRWELKEQKRQLKRKTPKIKQLKVK